MNLIVAADKNWAIGKDGKLLVSIPADLKLFRRSTMGKVVVMGRKTLDSLPNGLPLAGRTNIVLTENRTFDGHGAILVYSLEELMDQLGAYPSEEVYVAGGDSIYRQLLPYCDTAYVTRIDYAFEADRYFPDLDKDAAWEKTGESEEQTYFDLEYRFVVYKKRGA